MTSTMRVNAANTARTKPTTGDTKMSFVNTDHLGWLKCDGRVMDKTADNLLFQVIGYTFGGSGNSFNLPDPAGRVMGTVGTVNDGNLDDPRSRIFTAGQVVGEVDHKLTVNEMPAHNHNMATASPGANTTADGTTSVQADHTHGITDPKHSHTYQDAYFAEHTASGGNKFGTSAGVDTDNSFYYRKSDGSYTTNPADPLTQINTSDSYTGITVNAAGSHSHTISSNGNNEYHNNMQPTLFYGNTFIYCGVPMRGEFPFKTGLAPVLI
jgi:microcystin-dependent protein